MVSNVENKAIIFVVGSINVDYITEMEIFPKEGETVSGTGFRKAAGGKGANQAVQLARLGAKVSMVGAVGNDADGREMRELLLSEGLCTDNVYVKDGVPTGCATILLQGSKNRIIVYSGANGRLEMADVEFLKEAVSDSDMVVLQHEIPMQINEVVADYAFAKGVPVLLNTAPFAPVPSALMSHITYLCANETEAESLSGVKVTADIETVKAAAEKILSLGAKNVLLTLGSAGAYLLGECGEYYSAAASGIDVVDTTAAGDSFIGGFVWAITNGMDTQSALDFANRTAAVTVSRKGAIPSLPKLCEVE